MVTKKIYIVFLFCISIVFFACKKNTDTTAALGIGSWKVGSKTYIPTFTTSSTSNSPFNYNYTLYAYVKMPSTTPIVDMLMIVFMNKPTTSGIYKIVNKTTADSRANDEIIVQAVEEIGSKSAKAKTEGKTATVTVINGKISIEIPIVNAVYDDYPSAGNPLLQSTRTLEATIREQ